MMHIKFCDCLKRLLTELGISSSRLAKAINVDSSLVNRWINGKRIPSYSTAYIENIADYLCKNIHNTFQEQQIQDFINDICGTMDHAETFKDQVQYVLLEAQGYSIQCAQKEKLRQKSPPAIKYHSIEIPEADRLFSLSEKDKFLTTCGQITETCLSMLEAALSVKAQNQNTIYIVYDDYFFPDLWSGNEFTQLTEKLFKAAQQGWKIALFLRLTYDTKHLLRLMELAKPLLFTGKFTPYYIPDGDSAAPGKGLFAVPGVGMLSCLSNEIFASLPYALYFTTPSILDIYLSQLKQFLKEHAISFLERHYGKKYCYSSIKRMERNSGSRFLYNYFFSMMTIPESLYYKLLDSQHLTDEEKEKSMELYQRRYHSFLSNIQHYFYFDIYTASCMDELIEHHQIYFYSYAGVKTITLETADVIEHLRYMIYLLESYENYQIAFYQTAYREDTGQKMYCLVKEHHGVLFELHNLNGHQANLKITSEEPMLTAGFYSYLRNIWERIPPVNKNKSDVIRWLDSTINVLKA